MVRPTLDPNASNEPAIAMAAVLLLLYVFLLGPVNFSYVVKQNRPMRALVTTPILAGICLLLMTIGGFLSKGVAHRQRQVELVETVSGSSLAYATRLSGFFSTRPTQYELTSTAHGEVLSGPSHYQPRADGLHLQDIRSGVWETVFVREDEVIGLGEGIELVSEGGRYVAVRNNSELTLRDAVLTSYSGEGAPIGTVAPGATVEIPTIATPLDFRRASLAAGGTEQEALMADALMRRANLYSAPLQLVARVESSAHTRAGFDVEEAVRMICVHGGDPNLGELMRLPNAPSDVVEPSMGAW